MPLQLGLEHGGQQVGVNAVHGADFQRGLGVAGLVKLGLPVQGHPLFRQRDKLLALAGEGKLVTALDPLKEPEPQLPLQRFQLPGQGGLGDKQRFRRSGNTAVPHNGQERLHISVGHNYLHI